MTLLNVPLAGSLTCIPALFYNLLNLLLLHHGIYEGTTQVEKIARPMPRSDAGSGFDSMLLHVLIHFNQRYRHKG